MSEPQHQHDRSDRLAALLAEQRRLHRRRRLTGASAVGLTAVALSAGLLWSLNTGQPPAPIPTTPIATGPQEQDPPVPEQPVVELALVERVQTSRPSLIERVAQGEPSIERINDADLLIALDRQGVSVGILRVGGRAEIAMNTPDTSGVFWSPETVSDQ